MKQIQTACKVFVLLVFLTFPLSGQTLKKDRFQGRDVVAGEVIVRFRAATPGQRRNVADAVMAQDAEIEASDPVGVTGAVRLRSRGRSVEDLMRALAARPDVEFVEPNFIWHASDFPNDLLYGNQWGLTNSGQAVHKNAPGISGADIKAKEAWNITTGSRSFVIGVIDSGIQWGHTDLAANMWSAPAAFSVTISGQTINCAAGTRGFNAISRDCVPDDRNGHGTAVAGIIGATGNNGFGVSGVSPVAQMMSLRFLNVEGEGTTENAIAAIDFAIQAKAQFGTAANIRILNASWGSLSFSQALLDEINLAGNSINNMLFVTAAGNEGLNTDSTPSYPSSFDAPSLISVAATDNTDTLASFSNFGAVSIDIAAPGVDIYSTLNADLLSSGFDFFSGTSMSAPMVTGAAALVLSACPGMPTAQLKSTLLAPSSVDSLASLAGKVATGGRLNVVKALNTCGAFPTSDFRLGASMGFPVVVKGATTSAIVALSTIGSFTSDVTLTVNAPSGFATSLTSPFLGSGNPTTSLSITPGSTVNPGIYVIGITGTANGVSQTTGIEVIVTQFQNFNSFSNDFSKGSYQDPNSLGRYVAFYPFTTNARTVTINLTSNVFDTWLYLLDINGTVLASDQGGAGGNNSRITAALPTGTYYIKVTSRNQEVTGTYNIQSDLLILATLSPTSVRQNGAQTIFFTGDGFFPGISFGAMTDITVSNLVITSQTNARATFTVAANATLGERSIMLIDALGGSNSMKLFVISDVPTITGLSPTSGLAGTTVSLTLTGGNFTAPLTIFANSNSQIVPVSNVVINSSTSLTATLTLPVPSYISALPYRPDVGITVQTPSGQSNFVTIAVTPLPPALTSVLPIPLELFRGKTSNFFIEGTNLFPPITMNVGSNVGVAYIDLSTDKRLTTGLTAAPDAVLGPRTFSITGHGGTSNAVTLNVREALAPPTLTSITPNFGRVGELTQVTLKGTNFGGPISFSGSGLSQYGLLTVVDENTIIGTIQILPNATLGARNFTLETLWGTTAPVEFTVLPPLPTLGNINPAVGVPGSSQFVIFSGANFIAPATINVSGSGVTVSAVTIVNALAVSATVTVDPSASLGPRSITVTAAGGTTGSLPFTVVERPSLTSINPSLGPLGKNVSVSMTGSGFATGMSISPGAGISVSNINVSTPTSATATFGIAAGATIGPRNVTVSYGTGVSNSISFGVTSALPDLISINPSTGVLGSPVTVTLTGLNFGPSMIVNAGAGINVSDIHVNSSTSATAVLTITVAAQPGARSMTLTTSDGTGLAATFNVTVPPPILNSISPAFGGQGASVPVTLNGENFVSGMTVFAGPGIAVSSVAPQNLTTATATFSIATDAVLGARNVTVSTLYGTSYTVVFTVNPPSLTLTETGTGDGIVTTTPAGIDCGDTCSTSFDKGQTVTLHPAAAAGSIFNGWSGDSDCADGNVTMTTSINCVARFELPQTDSSLLKGDYDGDGKSDIAVYRPSTGEWFLRLSSTGFAPAQGNWYFQWGGNGDIPITGDFDGDGRSEIAVYRPSTGAWLLRLSTQNYAIAAGNWYFEWGVNGDVPITGDFDGDGRTEIAVYRPISGEWFLRLSSFNYAIGQGNWIYQWGLGADQPVAGDFDGDKKTDIAVYRPSTGEWFFRLSSFNYAIGQGDWTYQWGVGGDVPIKGDFDGDAKAEIAVFRPSTREWFFRLSALGYGIGQGNWTFQWGGPGDLSFRR